MIRAEGGMKMLESIQSEQIKKFVAIVVLGFLPSFVAAQVAHLDFLFLWGLDLVALILLVLFLGQELFQKWTSVKLWNYIGLAYLAYCTLTLIQFALVFSGAF